MIRKFVSHLTYLNSHLMIVSSPFSTFNFALSSGNLLQIESSLFIVERWIDTMNFQPSTINHPMLIINFKNYQESTGSNAIALARVIDEAAANAPVDVLIAVPILDLEAIAKSVKHVKVIAQHVDGVGYGAHTGHILPEEVKKRGAVGTLINHSEHPVPRDQLGKLIDLAQVHFPQYTIVCTPSYESTVDLDNNFDPKKIAYEPPELIGGDISVCSAKPDIIRQVVGISHERQILVGAGIKTLEDIQVSLQLGAIGVLVASGVVKDQDPGAIVRQFLSAWK